MFGLFRTVTSSLLHSNLRFQKPDIHLYLNCQRRGFLSFVDKLETNSMDSMGLDSLDVPPLLRNSFGAQLLNLGERSLLTMGEIVHAIPQNFHILNSEETIAKQWTLCETAELMRASQFFHMSVKDETQDNENAKNKLAILKGDFLLANACVKLASLRNPKVVACISTALKDFTETAFLQSKVVPLSEDSCDHLSTTQWKERVYLSSGSLLANLCKSSAILMGLDSRIQQDCFDFGKYISLAFQAHCEIKSLKSENAVEFLDLYSLPLLLEIQSPDILRSCIASTTNIESEKGHEMVSEASVSQSKEICSRMVKLAAASLSQFSSDSTRTDTLWKIIYSLGVH